MRVRSPKLILATLLFGLIGTTFLSGTVSSSVLAGGCNNNQPLVFMDENGQPLTTNPQVYRPMRIRFQGCTQAPTNGAMVIKGAGPNNQNLVIPMTQVNGVWESTGTFQIERPAGSFFDTVFTNADTGQELYPRQIVVEANANGIADGLNSGCCSNNNQCMDWFGTSSSCSLGNGACGSGLQCAGGSQLQENAACDPAGSLGACVAGTSCVTIGGNSRCLKPCSALGSTQAQYDCMNARYSFDLGSDQCQEADENCQCTADRFVGSYEQSFAGGNNSISICMVQSNDSTGSGSLFFTNPRTSCDEDNPRCDSINVNVTDVNSPVNAIVQVGCLTPGTYNMRVGRSSLPGVIDNELKSIPFSVGPNDTQVSLSLGVIPFEQGNTSFQVTGSDSSDVLCNYTRGNLDGSAPPNPPAEAPDPSTDYGSRNCPYAISCSTESLTAAYGPIVGTFLSGACQNDPSLGFFKPDVSPAAKPVPEQLVEFQQCSQCIRESNGTWTEAFGCIVTTPEGIFTALIRVALGVMGGVALIRITYLGIITAQSSDEGKIAEARKGVIATLAALAVVVFSVLILRIIGVNILNVVPAGFFG